MRSFGLLVELITCVYCRDVYMSVSQVLGNQHGVTVAAWCIVMSLVMRMVQPSGDSRLCGTSLDLGDEALEDEPARFATSRVGHSIIGLQPNGVPYTYSHIRSLVVQRTQETLPQTQAQACLWSRARSRLFLQDECLVFRRCSVYLCQSLFQTFSDQTWCEHMNA